MSKKYGGAHRVKVPGLNQISIDLKPHRSVSDVFINQKMDLTELVKYINEKKKDGESITLFHAFITAIGKTIYNRPKLNYFVANRHLWEHEKIVISFVAKVSFDDHSEEMMVMVPIERNDTIYTISKKVHEKVESFRRQTVSRFVSVLSPRRSPLLLKEDIDAVPYRRFFSVFQMAI